MGMTNRRGSSFWPKLYVFVCLLALSAMISAGTVYRWVDENGKVHYSDRPQEAADHDGVEAVELREPQTQSNSAADRRQQEINARWFEQRREQRESEEEEERKARAKAYKANEKYRKACKNARNRLADARKELKARKRAGIKPRVENALEIRIERYRDQVKRRC